MNDKGWFFRLLDWCGLVRTEYVVVTKPLRKKLKKHDPREVTGRCGIEDGEFGAHAIGVIECPSWQELVVKHHCVHEDKLHYCTYYSECAYKRTSSEDLEDLDDEEDTDPRHQITKRRDV